MFKDNNKDIRAMSLTWRHSVVFIVNFEHVSHLFLCFYWSLCARNCLLGWFFLHWFSSWKVKINHRKSHFHVTVSLTWWFWECSEAAGRICFTKEVLLKILQNLQTTTCARVFINKIRLANLFKKRLRQRCFIVKYLKLLRTVFL